MNGYRQNGERARIIIILFITLFVIMVASLATQLWQYSVIVAFDNGTTDNSQLTFSDTVVRIPAIAYSIIFILCTIYFIRWFRRAYYNYIQLNLGAASFTEGWAAGAWFVPFTNLVRPYRIMQELWHGTLKLLSGNSTGDYPSTLIGAWWLTWILYNFVSSAGNRLRMYMTTIDSIKTAILVDVVGDIIGLVSLIFIILLVRSYAELEKRLEEAISLPQDSIFALNTNTAYYQSRQAASENQASNIE